MKTIDQGTWSGSAITSRNYNRYWELDQLGNWPKLRNGLNSSATVLQERVHNEANELTGFTTPTTTIDPVFDNAGNATTIPSPKSFTTSLTLKYDPWNRLVEVKNSGGTTITANEYDGLNRRIIRNETGGSGTLRHFYYNEQWQVLVEADNSLAATAMYAYHPHYVDAVAFKLTSGTDYVYLQDANFNVTAVVDNSGGTSGNVVERYSYTPYGEIAYLDASFAALSTQASAIGNEIFYTGRERDPETGLQLNRNRFYHATLGRWVNRDPIGYEGGTLNLYEYVNSRAITAMDPMGNGPLACAEALIDCAGCALTASPLCWACSVPCAGAATPPGAAACAACLLGCTSLAGVCGAICACKIYEQCGGGEPPCGCK